MADLQDFKDDLARDEHGMTTADAHARSICINCKLPAAPRCYSAAGRKEYQISGMCEKCFDELFAEDGE